LTEKTTDPPNVPRTHRANTRWPWLVLCGTACVLALACIPAATAQVVTARTVHNKVKNPKPKIDSFRGDVVNFSNVAITVRDRKNLAAIRTFTYAPKLARTMENRHMEPGTRVTVRFTRNSETAVALEGKTQKVK
jgi:hypothetical protein